MVAEDEAFGRTEQLRESRLAFDPRDGGAGLHHPAIASQSVEGKPIWRTPRMLRWSAQEGSRGALPGAGRELVAVARSALTARHEPDSRTNSPSKRRRRWSDEPNPGRGAPQAFEHRPQIFEQPGRFAQPRHVPGVGDHRLADTLVLLERLLGVAVEIGARGLQPLGLGLRLLAAAVRPWSCSFASLTPSETTLTTRRERSAI
jgi:hypothetical protein